MGLASREIEIKYIREIDLLVNKNVLISLLEDNYRINFPNINGLTKFAIAGYEDMIRFKRDKTAILIGAFKGERIIGFLWAYKRNMLGENRIHIGHIIVNNDVRSKGIGTKLLNYLESIAKEEGYKKIELITTIKNEKTLKFYKTNGFSAFRVQLEKELGDKDDNKQNSN